VILDIRQSSWPRPIHSPEEPELFVVILNCWRYLILAGFFGVGVLLIFLALARLKRHRKHIFARHSRSRGMQLGGWSILIALAFVAFMAKHVLIGIVLILFAQLLPIKRNCRTGPAR